MPATIALYIKQAHEEDKFGHEFISGIDLRVQEMNATQLRGLYNHLKRTSREAKIDMWKNANLKLISHIETLMREKEAVIEKAQKKKEEANAAERNRERMKKMRAELNMHALEVIEQQARIKAEEEIKEAEKKRQILERTEIMVKTIAADDRKERVWKRTAVCYFVSVVGTCAIALLFLQSVAAVIIGAGVSLYTVVAASIAYKYYVNAIIAPMVVTEQDLEAQIEKRQEELNEEGLLDKKLKDEQFKRALAVEKLERKERKRKEKEKKEYEEKLMAERAAEQSAAYEEMSRAGISMTEILSGSISKSKASHAQDNSLDDGSICSVSECEVAERGGEASEALRDTVGVRFLSVELANTALFVSSPRGTIQQWVARISSSSENQESGFALTFPCVKNDGLNALFKVVLNSNASSSICKLEAGQKVKIVIENVARTEALTAIIKAEDKADKDIAVDESNNILGVFEAMQDDFASLLSSSRTSNPLCVESEWDALDAADADAEGKDESAAGEEVALSDTAPPLGVAHQPVSLRGMLLNHSYQRMADVVVNCIVVSTEPDP